MKPEEMDANLQVLADALIMGTRGNILSAASIPGVGEALQKRVLARRLDVPEIKSILKLDTDWTFTLHQERRNMSLVNQVVPEEERPRSGYNYMQRGVQGSWEATMPKGTELVVDRIYIRQGQKKYDSITFRVKSCPIKEYEKCRFWVKLKDANNMFYSRVEN